MHQFHTEWGRMMQVRVEVNRFDPRSEKGAWVQAYTVEAEETDRVLDVLIHIKDTQDASLTFRYSCAHGVCGSDAMRINDKERLACKTLVRDVVTPNARR